MLSKNRKEELKNAVIEAKETEEYMVEQEQELGKGSIDQSWHILLTYLSTENLVKHSENLFKSSENLNKWTKVIAITTIALIFFTIAQIVLIILLRQ